MVFLDVSVVRDLTVAQSVVGEGRFYFFCGYLAFGFEI